MPSIKQHPKLEREWVVKEIAVEALVVVDKSKEVEAEAKSKEAVEVVEVEETVVTMLLFLQKATLTPWSCNQKISG